MMGGTNNQPGAVEGSVTADFTNYAPSQRDGTVVDTCALSWVISDDQVNAVRWLSPAGSAQSMQLGIGTSGGEQILQAATTAQALTPTSVQAYRETTLGGAANVDPQRIAKSVLFINRNGRKMHEWTFQWQVNGYVGPDLAVFAEHITRAGIAQTAYQQLPYSIIWAVRRDGTLIGLTYDREQQVTAWHRHQLGGQYYGGPPLVESLTCIPSSDASYDELWLSVLRTINGTPTRMIEVMTPFFDHQPGEQAFFMDAAASSTLVFPAATLTLSGLANVSAVTEPALFTGANVTLTASAAVFSAGTVGSLVRVNGGIIHVTGYTDATHVTGATYVGLTSLAPAAANSWSCTPQSSTFSGLSHLTGEVAQLLGDGADFATQTVAAGAVILPNAGTASFLTAGLPYLSELVTMPFEPMRAAGAASSGKAKRIDTMYLRLHESLGCNFGSRTIDPLTSQITDVTEALQTRSAADAMGQPPALFSGIARLKMPGGYDLECQIEINTTGPMPLTVLAICASADVGEEAAL